jgi:hypothetical protein
MHRIESAVESHISSTVTLMMLLPDPILCVIASPLKQRSVTSQQTAPSFVLGSSPFILDSSLRNHVFDTCRSTSSLNTSPRPRPVRAPDPGPNDKFGRHVPAAPARRRPAGRRRRQIRLRQQPQGQKGQPRRLPGLFAKGLDAVQARVRDAEEGRLGQEAGRVATGVNISMHISTQYCVHSTSFIKRLRGTAQDKKVRPGGAM